MTFQHRLLSHAIISYNEIHNEITDEINCFMHAIDTSVEKITSEKK